MRNLLQSAPLRIAALALLVAPSSALAWSVVVPTDADAPCVQLDQHVVTVDITPGEARAVTELQFRALTDGDAHVLLPELAAGSTAAWLDGEKLVFDRLEPRQATDRLVSLALTRVRPTLLLAAHRPLLTVRVPLSAGPHTLRVEAPVAVDWAATVPHAVVPLRTLGTACHRIPVQATVNIETASPLGAAFTPYHDTQVERPDAHHATLSLHGDAQKDDLHIYLATANRPIAAKLLSWRAQECGAPDAPGYMMVAAGPTTTEQADAVAKDVVLVVDRSGSMEGEKIVQVRRALGSILGALGEEDRFDVITFNGGASPIFGRLEDAGDRRNRDRAAAMVEDLTAGGATDIHGALLTAFSELSQGDHTRPRMVVFLTDGQATAGVTDTDAILADVAAANEVGARIFAFGVGHSVNTRLLDELSVQTGTTARYIQPGTDIDAVLVDFYRDIQAPVLTNVALDAHGVEVSDVLPRALPDLYIGTQMLVSARYTDARDARVELSGTDVSGAATFPVDGALLRYGEDHAFLPRLWASRRMAELLYEARQNGGEAAHVDEITALAWRYGFVTRFTEFRVADNGSVEAGYSNPTGDEVGEEAVGTSSDINSMSRNDNAGGFSGDGGAVDMVQVRDRTFVHDHMYWLDTTVPVAPADVLDVRLGSDAWRDLLDAGAGPFLAVGRNVMFQWRCRTVRVTDPNLVEEAPDPDALPAELVGPGPRADAMGDLPFDPEADREREAGCATTGDSGGLGWWALLLLGLPRRRRA